MNKYHSDTRPNRDEKEKSTHKAIQQPKGSLAPASANFPQHPEISGGPKCNGLGTTPKA